MEHTHLGRSGLSVSRLCLGTMNFGPLTPPADAHAIMDHAHEIGINFFDTANRYGGRESPPGQITTDDESHSGWTEEIIGDWFAGRSARRERTVLATKLYGAMSDWPNDGKLSALNIRRACEASLSRLQTDYIDLYQMHHVDRDTPWEEIWQAMEVLPAAIDYGVGVIPWSPLYGGLLGGVLKKERDGRRRLAGRAKEMVEQNRAQIEAYEDLCDELGEEPANVALAWLLHQEGVTGPIIGPRTVAQLDDAQRAVTLRLDDDVLKRLDALFPGYQPAPEHYAW